jgi:hypothetical protein
MISPREAGRARIRRGFSLLEVQAAFVILGFSVAALFPFAVAQFRLVAALERRLPPGVTFALVSRDHRMVNLLVAGSTQAGSGSPTPAPVAASQGPQLNGSVAASSTNRAVVIETVVNNGGLSGNDMTATVVVKMPASQQQQTQPTGGQ